jgi:Tn3 transposase DDE domain
VPSIAAVQHLRARGVSILDDLLAHVAPLGWEHIALTGDYIWNDSNPATGFRPLRDVRGAFLPQAA